MEKRLIKKVEYLRKQYERGKMSTESKEFYRGLFYAVKEMENFISENIAMEVRNPPEKISFQFCAKCGGDFCYDWKLEYSVCCKCGNDKLMNYE